MKILALDYGTKRVGVAISDYTRTLARPLPFIDATPFQALATKVRELCRAEEVSLILVGLPRNMDGSYGPAAERVREFISHLKTAVPMPIQEIDERLSTVQASRLLHEGGKDSRKQKTLIDSATAAVLLQSHLDFPNLQFKPTV
jgi:putative Holliday junction resolvase